MASVLIAASNTVDPSSFSPQTVLHYLDNFTGWQGSKAVINWRGLMFWHAGTCALGICSHAAGLTENICRCKVMRAAIQLATRGLEPALWYAPSRSTASTTTTKPSNKSIHLTQSEESFAKVQHDKFEAAGVLVRVPNRQVARWRAQGTYPSNGFVVRKWKALQTPMAAASLYQWLNSEPAQVRAFVAGDNTVQPPSAAYKGKDRVVYNFREVNENSINIPMTFSTIREVFQHLAAGDWLLVLDIEDGFTGIPVARAASSLFWVRTQGQRDVVLQRMPFGYSLAPYVFCFISSILGVAVSSAMQSSAAGVFVYMDDVFVRFKSATISSASAAKETAVQVFREFGFNVNPHKVDGPARTVTYLGYTLTATAATRRLSMPSEKLFTYTQLLGVLSRLIQDQRLASGRQSLPKKTLESLIGKLEHVSSLLPLAKHRLARLYALTGTRTWRYTRNMGEVPLTTRVIDALEWFLNQINSRPEILESFQPIVTQSNWAFFGASDASGEGGIGGYLTATASPLQQEVGRASHWSVRIPGTSSATELLGQSTALELKGVILAIEAARSRVGPACIHPTFRLSLAIDSQAAHYLCRKGYSTANSVVNDLAGRVKELTLATGCDLETLWVARESNTLADALSHPDRDHSGLHLKDPPRSLPQLIASSKPIARETDHTHDETSPKSGRLPRSQPARPGPKNSRLLAPLHITLTLLSLLLFTVLRACEAELSFHNAGEARIEARVRVDALATSTSRGYFSAATRFIRSIPGPARISYGTVTKFVEHLVVSGAWASHNVSSYTTDLASALNWLALPLPANFTGKRKDWLLRAMRKARGSRGPKKRKYFSIRRLHRVVATILSTAPNGTGAVAAAAAWLGFLGTMRPNEIRKLRQRHIKPLPRKGTPDRFRIRISDKTHPHNNRRIVVPILDSWKREGKKLRKRLTKRQRNAKVFDQPEWDSLAAALKAHRRGPGNLRPAGNTFWNEADARGAVIVANGGWTQKSQVPGKHYTTVTGSIATKLKALAEARIRRSGVRNAGGTPRPRR